MSASCIAQPISWLVLERYALQLCSDGERAAVAAHLAACEVCNAAWSQLQADQVALPPLPQLATPAPAPVTNLAEARQARRLPRYVAMAAPVVALAAGALLWVATRSSSTTTAPAPGIATSLMSRTSVKGVGELTLRLARNRNNHVTLDASTFVATDAWKLMVTCSQKGSVDSAGAPGANSPDDPLEHDPANVAVLTADVVVFERAANGKLVPSYPMAPSELVCGNQVAIPGAFSLDTKAPHVACVGLSSLPHVDRNAISPGAPDTICAELVPE